MTNDSPSSWGRRALQHARILTEATPGRGSATRLETQAAIYVHTQLKQMGYEVRQQPFIGLRSVWFFLAMVFGFASLGHIGGPFLAYALGPWSAWGVRAALFGFAFYLMWRKFTFRSFPLRASLPQGPSQNLIAVAPASGEVRRRVVVNAHLDSHRAVIWFASDWLTRLYLFLSPVIVYGLLAAPLCYALALLTDLSIFTGLGAALGALHFLAWFTGVTADLGRYSPGANDNASSLGVLLTLAERLRSEPLPDTEVWLLATGCEESGCDGMRAFLRDNGEALAGAFFLNLEVCGIGEEIAYLAAEGVVRRRRIAPQTAAILEQSGARPVSLAQTGFFTETGAVWEHGHQGACLLTLPAGSDLIPEWHRMSDTAEKLQPAALQRMHEFVWQFLRSAPIS